MQEKYLFEYAVIRVVPRVEREEFLNVGIVMYCRDLKFLKCVFSVDHKKIESLCAGVDCTEIEDHLRSFEKISHGDKGGGPIAQLDLASRFRWLTATRSTVVQTSKVHPGFCANADETLEKLNKQLVL